MEEDYDLEADINAQLEMYEEERALTIGEGIEDSISNVHPINSQFDVSSIKSPKPIENPFDKVPPISELLNTTIPKKVFLFEGDIIPKNEVTVTPAAGGTGKTLFAGQVSMQSALGKTFMMTPKGKKVFVPHKEMRVLYLSYEDSREDILRRMQGVLRAYPDFDYSERAAIKKLDENLKVVYMPEDTDGSLAELVGSHRMAKSRAYSDLERHLEERHYDLVIIDPFHYSAELEENGNAAMGAYMQLLRDLCTKHNTTVWAFAHTSRGNQLEARGAASVQQRSRQGIMFADYLSLIENKYLDERLRRSLPSVDAIPEGIDRENVVCIKTGKNNHGAKHKEWLMLEIKSIYPDEYDHNNSYPAMIPFDVLDRAQIEDNKRQRPLNQIEKQVESLLFSVGSDGLSMRQISEELARNRSQTKAALDVLVERNLVRQFDGKERDLRKGIRFAVVGNTHKDITKMMQDATEKAENDTPVPWELNE